MSYFERCQHPVLVVAHSREAALCTVCHEPVRLTTLVRPLGFGRMPRGTWPKNRRKIRREAL